MVAVVFMRKVVALIAKKSSVEILEGCLGLGDVLRVGNDRKTTQNKCKHPDRNAWAGC